jgi:hypothetical protein
VLRRLDSGDHVTLGMQQDPLFLNVDAGLRIDGKRYRTRKTTPPRIAMLPIHAPRPSGLALPTTTIPMATLLCRQPHRPSGERLPALDCRYIQNAD